MIHIASSRFIRDQEMSCDEPVLQSRSSDECIAYARLLGEGRVAADAGRLRSEVSVATTAPVRLAALKVDRKQNQVEVLSQAPPKYPGAAAIARVEGPVLLEFDLMPDNQISNVRVLESVPEEIFDQAAIEAISRWEMVNNDDTTITINQRLEFKLDD